LRANNISCEIYPTEAKLKKQLGYANAKQIQKVVLIGSEELAQKSFILKNMESGTQEIHPLSELTERLS
jgi:histidyl-tRNA synthetase